MTTLDEQVRDQEDPIDKLQRDFFLNIRAAVGNAGASDFLKLVEEIKQDRDALRKSIRTMYSWLSSCGLEKKKLFLLSERPEVRRALDGAEHTRDL